MKKFAACIALLVIAASLIALPLMAQSNPPLVWTDPPDIITAQTNAGITLTSYKSDIEGKLKALYAAVNAIQPGTVGPAGAAGTISVGAVLTGAPGSQAAVTNSGTPNAAMLNFTIPQGADGASGTINIGSVLTGAPGSQASVTNSGTPSAAVLNFSIPQGNPGPSVASLWVGVDQVTSLKHSDTVDPSFAQGLPGVSDKTFIYIKPGDFLDFPLNVPAGSNAIAIALSSNTTPGTFHFEFPAGTKIGATTTAVNTANWFSYTTIVVPVGPLPGGSVLVRWVAETSGMNVAGVKPAKQ